MEKFKYNLTPYKMLVADCEENSGSYETLRHLLQEKIQYEDPYPDHITYEESIHQPIDRFESIRLVKATLFKLVEEIGVTHNERY